MATRQFKFTGDSHEVPTGQTLDVKMMHGFPEPDHPSLVALGGLGMFNAIYLS